MNTKVFLLFGSQEDVDNYIEDKDVEAFEDNYETLIIENNTTTEWFRALELTKRYGDYCSLSQDEFDKFETL